MQTITTTNNIDTEKIQNSCYIQPRDQKKISEIKNRLLEVIDSMISPKKELTLDDELNNKFLSLDFGSEFDIDATKIGINDAIFFVNLLNRENLIDYSVENDNLTLSFDNKTIKATNSLLNMLKTSYDTQKSIRLDFDEDVTVILKLDKNGKIQAHFIPGSIEVENYIKNNIPILKQTFDDEQINYSYLGYSKNKNNNKENKSKKEQ